MELEERDVGWHLEKGGETCQLISVIRLSCWMGFLHLFSSQICCLVHVSCESVLPFRVFS